MTEGGTAGLVVGGCLCLSLAGKYVVLKSLNLDASLHTAFTSLTTSLAWMVEPMIFEAM